MGVMEERGDAPESLPRVRTVGRLRVRVRSPLTDASSGVGVSPFSCTASQVKLEIKNVKQGRMVGNKDHQVWLPASAPSDWWIDRPPASTKQWWAEPYSPSTESTELTPKGRSRPKVGGLRRKLGNALGSEMAMQEHESLTDYYRRLEADAGDDFPFTEPGSTGSSSSSSSYNPHPPSSGSRSCYDRAFSREDRSLLM
eukprot:Hpha_TRINITY_DN15811_c2_g7::TRINITY_DN15811_c2_g7_i1::g.187519::m.187519